MRSFLLPLLALALGWTGLACASAPTVDVQGTLSLNGSIPLDNGAVALLSPLSPPPGTVRKEQAKEIFGRKGENKTERLKISASLYSPVTRSAVPGSALPYPLIARSSPPLPPSPHSLPSSQAFSLFAFLKGNPMVWIMVLGVALAVGFPRIIASLDEETREEMGKVQGDLHKALQGQGSLVNVLAGGTIPERPSEKYSSAAELATGTGTNGAKASGGGGGGGGKARRRK
ncbi:hypothetical protein JCM11251_007346 [Rhodosporidiobolus azoricus]